ncbi:hypothetical protein PRVXH_000722 [Proteinivorax hydrogeniformans]|uniref:Uncharacterized protein n=1 Tax=Proteinivorax hydrogeniformans TaxID=1826727 RepID=A0AAU8HVI6_9FIRM
MVKRNFVFLIVGLIMIFSVGCSNDVVKEDLEDYLYKYRTFLNDNQQAFDAYGDAWEDYN